MSECPRCGSKKAKLVSFPKQAYYCPVCDDYIPLKEKEDSDEP